MSKQIILFNFASRGRPGRANKAVESIASLCTNLKGYFTINMKVDTDDPDLSRYIGYFGSCAFGRSTSKIHAINRDIPATEWDILINMSDDIVWTKKGFDDIIRHHCGPDDFLLIPEPFADSQAVKGKNDRIAIVSIMGRKYYERDGYVYHPSYKSLFCDNEATEVARRRGRLKEIDDILFYHEHPAAGYRVNDDRYRHTESFWKEDKANYYARKEAGFP